MSLKEDRELEHFESLMYLEEQGTAKDPGPYWVTRQPWKIDKENLVDNKPAILGVMNSTKAKLNRKPNWRAIYEKQLLDILDRGFTREVLEEELHNWIQKEAKLTIWLIK